MRQRWRSLNRRLREKWDWSFAHSWIMFTEGQNEWSYKDEWEMWKKIEITKQIQTRLNSSFRFFFSTSLHRAAAAQQNHSLPIIHKLTWINNFLFGRNLDLTFQPRRGEEEGGNKVSHTRGPADEIDEMFSHDGPDGFDSLCTTTAHHTSARERTKLIYEKLLLIKIFYHRS